MLRTFFWIKWKSLEAQLQYPLNFLTSVVGICMIGVLDITLLLVPARAFQSIGGWDFWELAFLFSLLKMAHGLHQLVFLPFWWHDDLVRKGQYDVFLVRPVHPILQILASDFSVSVVGEWIPSVTLFLLCAPRVRVPWTAWSIVFLVVSVVAGAVIEWAVMLALAGLSFWTARTQNVKFVADMFLFRASIYPTHVFSRPIRLVLTFVLPYAFLGYYPAHHFFARTAEAYGPSMAYMGPLVAAVAVGVGYGIWTLGLRSYSSSGT